MLEIIKNFNEFFWGVILIVLLGINTQLDEINEKGKLKPNIVENILTILFFIFSP